MNHRAVASELAGRIAGAVRCDEPMARHTTYRVGGPAALYIVVDTLSDLARVARVLAERDIPLTVLGKGSNVLVSDTGVDGAIVVLGREFRRHEYQDGSLRAGAGAVLAHVVQDAFSQGLSGLEFAVGVPGTVGGALAMNAGSRDEWIGSRVDTVTVWTLDEGLVSHRGHEIAWGYRRSDLPGRGIIIECVLRVDAGDGASIRRSMEAALRRRRQSQPVGVACAGSVFVNPPGASAGRLIEQAGLKGRRVGGAVISEVHANFIVNSGGATARDIVDLISLVRTTVRDVHGIELKPEIRFIGSFEDA
jgi:UDP-N-acetylmuramate dehydrogenase